MRLLWIAAFLLSAGLTSAQLTERTEAPPESTAGLVDEDEDVLPQTEYAFNPIQAKKDLKVGKFYDKRGNRRAAAARYLEATKWNPTYAEAYWRLAEARDELNQTPQALDAYRAYLSLEPAGKQAPRAKDRIAALEESLKNPPVTAEQERDPAEPKLALPIPNRQR